MTGKSFTEEVAEVLERRTPKYQSAAQYEIDTEHLAPEQVADRIIAIFKEPGDSSRPREARLLTGLFNSLPARGGSGRFAGHRGLGCR